MLRTASHVPLQLARVFGRFAIKVLRIGLIGTVVAFVYLVLDLVLLGERGRRRY